MSFEREIKLSKETLAGENTTTPSPLPQADAYAGHERRKVLLRRVEWALRRFYPAHEDAYRKFEVEIASHLKPQHTLLDAGCGRSAPVLTFFAPKVEKAIGVDLVEFNPSLANSGILLIHSELGNIPLAVESVDIVVCRSVMEHLAAPPAVYAKIYALLKPGGKFIFITPNVWSYPIIAARMIPNRFHAFILDWAEGRPKEDAFDTYYRSNSYRSIRKLASEAGFCVNSLKYLSMFPNYLMFNSVAFMLGVAYERFVSQVQPLNPLQHWILAVLSKPEVNTSSAKIDINEDLC